MSPSQCVYVANASSSQPGLAETVELRTRAGTPGGLGALLAAGERELRAASSGAVREQKLAGLGDAAACLAGVAPSGARTAKLLVVRRAGSLALSLSTPQVSDGCRRLDPLAREINAKLG